MKKLSARLKKVVGGAQCCLYRRSALNGVLSVLSRQYIKLVCGINGVLALLSVTCGVGKNCQHSINSSELLAFGTGSLGMCIPPLSHLPSPPQKINL